MAKVKTAVGVFDSDSAAYKAYMAASGNNTTGTGTGGTAAPAQTGGAGTYAAAQQQVTAQKPVTSAQTLFEMDQKLEKGEITYGDYSKWWNATYKPSGGTPGSTTAQQPQQPQPAQNQPQTPAQQAAGKPAYTIGTELGAQKYYDVLNTGQQVTLNDETVLSKGSDGKIYAKKDGQWLNTNVTYKAETQQRDEDTANLAAALFSLFGGKNNAYQQALAQQQAANNAAVQKAVGDLQTQKQTTDNSYANLFRQLYINKMNAKKNEDQKLAAQGITGGMAESNRLGLETSYSEALRQGELQRLQTQTDLDKAITDTRLTGDIQNATAAAQAAVDGANSYAAVLQSLISRNDTLSAQEKSQAYALAMQMLGSGDQISDALRQQAGIGNADAQSILDRTSKPQYSQFTAAVALQALKNGSTDPKIRQIVEEFYGMPAEQVLLGQPKEENGFTAEQAAWALLSAASGVVDDATKQKLETYYGMPYENILAGYNAQKTYSAETVQVALTEAMKGNVTAEIRSIVESAFGGLPLETVVAAYDAQ